MDFTAKIYNTGECYRRQIPLKHAWALTARARSPHCDLFPLSLRLRLRLRLRPQHRTARRR